MMLRGVLRRSAAACNVRRLSVIHSAGGEPLDAATLDSYAREPAVNNDECGVIDEVVGSYHLRPALRVPSECRGIGIAHDALYNKGTAFVAGERDRLGLRGLLPPTVLTMEEQLHKIMASLRALPDPLAKHTFLSDLHDRNETLFHRVVVRHIEEIAPLIYTPTVGQACLAFGSTFHKPRGMYFTAEDRGHMKAMVRNWPGKDVRVVVVTDGGRVLGLGDLGANGMGIPIGKLALYCAAGGIAPHRVMPVVLDVGTNNENLLADPFYLGLKRPRLTGTSYYEVVHEFLEAMYERYPKALVQFEDFSSEVAGPLLEKYKDTRLCFNDDIQGTGATVSAGAMGCMRQMGLAPSELKNQRVVVVGAGSAGIGVAMALRDSMVAASGGALSPEEAADQFWILDQKGLLVANPGETFTEGQAAFAKKQGKRGASLLEVIDDAKPTMLLGLSTVGGLFNEEVIRRFAAVADRPIIMPLSNPTDRAECSAADAYKWTDGRAIFASGSPFPSCSLEGKTYTPSQCNNMFIFPGLGLGASIAECEIVSDDMLYAAAVACAESVSEEEINRGQVFPSVSRIREVSKQVAVGVVQAALKQKGNVHRAELLAPNVDIQAFISKKMYFPAYVPLFQSPYD